MPTIKIDDIVKNPSTLKAKKINRNSRKFRKHLEEVRAYIAGSRERQKVDWEKLRNIRFK